MLLGAELTRVFAERQGTTLIPQSFARPNLEAAAVSDMQEQPSASL